MKIFSKHIKYWLVTIFLTLFCCGTVSAATFYLEPASGTLIKGCSSQIKIKMSTEGQGSNGAQAYVDYSGLGSGNIDIAGAGLFGSYGIPPGVPSGSLGLYGYGGVVLDDALTFAVVTVNPGVNGALALAFKFGGGTITSKIAAYPSSENILSSVFGGSYTVIDGYCETQPPYLTNLDPTPNKPNHPVGQNIKFDIKDDGSGLNMSTFNVTVQQNGEVLPVVVSQVSHDADDKWYSIDIDPVNNLTPELKVVVTVTVSDKAGNTMNRTYQFNDLSCADLGCPVGGITPQCSDNSDNDSDGKMDFPEDDGCQSSDDNNEFLLSDIVCSAVTTTTVTTTISCAEIIPQCSDSIDNDNDNLVDMADPGCANPEDNNEFVYGEVVCPTTPTTTPPTVGFSFSNLQFYIANRSVKTAPDVGEAVDVLTGVSLTVVADLSGLDGSIISVGLKVGANNYPLYYDNALKKYAVDLYDLKSDGVHDALLTAVYGENQQAATAFFIRVLRKGVVLGAEADGTARPVINATIKLEQLSANNEYVQIAEAKTDASGNYGFVMPNGGYRLAVEAEGFRGLKTSGFQISNHIINRQLQLIRQIDLLDTKVSLTEKADYVTEVATEQVKKVIESVDDPKVESTAQKRVAPIALGAALAATVPALSFLNLLSYLRFLFLQPIFLLGYRKRKKWGVVYNSLTKMPIDLAVARLVDVKTGKIVQSRVTDSQGRYAFFVEPGIYRIEVTKQGFVFPTKILQGLKEDTGFLDIYHGEPVHVDERYAAIAANIPLDPIGAKEKTPRRIFVSRALRGAQRFIASLSIVAGAVAVFISPTWWTIGLLVLQVALYFLFKRLAATKKPKNWGIVYDKSDKKPINRVIARLFSKRFNKLVATEITDSNGRYSFMVGPNEYYVTFEKDGYKKTTSNDIRIKEAHEVVKVNIGLEKEMNNNQTPSTESKTPPATPQSPAPVSPLQPKATPPTPPVAQFKSSQSSIPEKPKSPIIPPPPIPPPPIPPQKSN